MKVVPPAEAARVRAPGRLVFLWAISWTGSLAHGSILRCFGVRCVCLFAEVFGHDGNNPLVIVCVSLAKLIRGPIPDVQQLIHYLPAAIYHFPNFRHGKRLRLSQFFWCEDERS